MSDDMKPSEVLEYALGHLEGLGWYQGDYFSPDDSSCCAAGAIGLVAAGRPGLDTANYLRKVIGGRLAAFNDAPGRKFSDIRRLFHKAIRLAQKDGR